MLVRDFEEKILDVEGVRLIVRAASDDMVIGYNFSRKYKGSNSIRSWLDARVWENVGNFDVVIVDGEGDIPKRNTLMENLRDTYDF